LLDHLIGNLGLLVTVARGEKGERPQGDQFDGDPGAAYGERREELLVAIAAEGVFERDWQMPFGDLPGSMMARVAFLEHLTHGWDVAKATGQDTTIPADLVETGTSAATAADDMLRHARRLWTGPGCARRCVGAGQVHRLHGEEAVGNVRGRRHPGGARATDRVCRPPELTAQPGEAVGRRALTTRS
jgi:hypothetical protein